MKKVVSLTQLTNKLSKIALVLLVTGCTITSRPKVYVEEPYDDIEYSSNRNGVVEYVWEEPMIDVIEVPPGLDPEGVYYRPNHHEVVEVRQGRWQYYKPNLSR